MKVKNGSCIRHLSFKTLMAARKRNIIAVLAIALTALLFTSLFTIVMSINETNQNYQFRSVGGYAHGSFKDVDEDQIKVLSAHPDVKAVGVRTVLGLATQGAFEKDYAEVSYMDDNNAKWSFSQPTVGRTPKSGNEITMDTKAMELLGVKPELGAQVKVTYAGGLVGLRRAAERPLPQRFQGVCPEDQRAGRGGRPEALPHRSERHAEKLPEH